MGAAGSVFEIVVVRGTRACPLRNGAALQELRGVLARLAWFAAFARAALGRVAADLGLQLDDIEEDIGLPAQLVGDHRRLR
jgi:hypothetical protein